MNKRIIEIIKTLLNTYNDGEYTISYFSKLHNVSERTIRNDFSVINDTLTTNNLSKISFGNSGKIICESDFSNIEKYIVDDDFYYYKLSKEERKFIASSLLINASEYITLSTIANHLSVSRATIISDLDSIKSFLKKNNLTTISHSNKGLRVEGLEIDKRKLLMKIAEYSWSVGYISSEKMLGIQSGNQVIIQKIINEQEHVHGYYLTDDSFNKILTYLRIMIQRNQQGEYIEKIDDIKILNSDKYRMAQDILKYVSQYCDNKTIENEIIFLTYVLDDCKYLKKKSNDSAMVKVQILTRRFIESVSDELGINLNNDYDFYENLSNHIESVFRNNYIDFGTNKEIDDVIARNKEILNAVKSSIKIYESCMSRKITDMEMKYIVIHICAAIERSKNKDVSLHVILSCHAGIGTSQLLLARLKNHFKFKIVDIISSHDIKNITRDMADLIITTVDIKNSPIEYVKVSPLLNDEDYIRVGAKIDSIRKSMKLPVREEPKEITARAIVGKLKNIIYEKVSDNPDEVMDLIKREVYGYFKLANNENEDDMFYPSLHHLLSEHYIKLDVECTDWIDSIKKSADILLKKGYIEEKYVHAMINNIVENGPYIIISEGFAMPHEGLDMGTIKMGMSLIRLKNPVIYDKDYEPVEFVCCLSAVDQKSHLKAFFNLVNILSSDGFKDEIRSAKTPREIAEIIEKYEYKTNGV